MQNAIKPTRVISGYGCNNYDWNHYLCNSPDNNGNNYITTDNLYLLSGVEVFGADGYDTAASTTTQLEYYVGKSDSYRIKQYSGSNYYYWLRLADSDDERSFFNVYDDGFLGWASSNYTGNGVVPAF